MLDKVSDIANNTIGRIGAVGAAILLAAGIATKSGDDKKEIEPTTPASAATEPVQTDENATIEPTPLFVDPTPVVSPQEIPTKPSAYMEPELEEYEVDSPTARSERAIELVNEITQRADDHILLLKDALKSRGTFIDEDAIIRELEEKFGPVAERSEKEQERFKQGYNEYFKYEALAEIYKHDTGGDRTDVAHVYTHARETMPELFAPASDQQIDEYENAILRMVDATDNEGYLDNLTNESNTYNLTQDPDKLQMETAKLLLALQEIELRGVIEEANGLPETNMDGHRYRIGHQLKSPGDIERFAEKTTPSAIEQILERENPGVDVIIPEKLRDNSSAWER